MTDDAARAVDRRAVLAAIAGTATLSGCSVLGGGDGNGGSTADGGTDGGSDRSEPLERGADSATTPVADERARELAERFAPTLYFDAAEQWFPTDPRPYERERDGETVVDGFAALDGYTERFDGDEPPAPTVFFNAVTYEDSPLAVVQYWFYSAFDQFTTNFHWHDWEVLHVFVDTEGGDPQLYVASSHSRSVPNNEYLDPERPPRVLSELGSHSSALSVNDAADGFQRFAVGDLLADITNTAIEGVEDVAELPLAYGLPRDEGGRLPYVVPELDGAPVYDHDRLPAVERSDLLPDALTVRSFDALATPPTDLPARSTGPVFEHASADGGGGDRTDGGGDDGSADETAVAYDLVPTAEVEDVTAFTGPQLSFEFAVPKAAEDAVASHLTAPSAPWKQPRYGNPAADISDPVHRGTLADRYDAIGAPAPVNAVLATVSEAVPSPDAPEGDGVTTQSSTVEAVALVESDPVAVPTFRGVVVARDVPAGDHRLTVNGAGLAPHSETVSVPEDGGDATTEAGTATTGTPADGADGSGTATDGSGTATDGSGTATDGTAESTGGGAADTAADRARGAGAVTVAGAGGEIPLVGRESATKLAVDPGGSDADLTDLAVEDDFAGRLYDAPLSGPDAVYVHRGGAYTAEVRDADDAVGAVRVNPADESRVTVDRPRTGKASLAEYLAAVAEETLADVEALLDETTDSGGGSDGQNGRGGQQSTDDGPGNAVRGLAQALEAVAEAARRAAERAAAGDRGEADASLRAVAKRLERATERLEAAREDLPPELARAVDNRFDQAERRSRQARRAEKL